MRSSLRFPPRSFRAAFAVALAAGLAGLAGGSHAASANADATAKVVTPIAISKTADLRFGAFSTSAAAQTVTIGTDDSRSNSGTLLVSSSNPGGGAFGAASFSVTGDSNLTYTITLPGSTLISTGAGNTDALRMTVNGFVSDPATTGALTAGAQTLKVGATLTTNAGQTAGTYTGSFAVSVEYN